MYSKTDPMIRLYQNHGSAIGYWEGWVEEVEVDDTLGAKVVIQYSKKLDGKPVRKEYFVAGKNIGKSNETEPYGQGVVELESKARLKMDKGYVSTLEEAKAPSTNGLGLLKPMLATPIDKVKPEKINWDNAYVQPKLDGHRALFKDGVLYSRQGKVLDLPHITSAIESMGMEHLHLDGELYLHGHTLQELSKLIKKNRPETINLEYHIYDAVQKEGFYDRIMSLADHFARVEDRHPALQPVSTHQVQTLEEAMDKHTAYRNQGYEGTMLRFGTEPYQDGKRSKTLLKIKEFQDEEFQIVGVQEGKPYVTDKGTFRVPVYECRAGHIYDERTFTVTAPGNMHEKHELWKRGAQTIGQLLTVKFHYYSKDGIPQLPVALRFHETV